MNVFGQSLDPCAARLAGACRAIKTVWTIVHRYTPTLPIAAVDQSIALETIPVLVPQ